MMLMHKTPLLMGGMMGLMLPWMMHMENGEGVGLAFVLAHVALIAGLSALALCFAFCSVALQRKQSRAYQAVWSTRSKWLLSLSTTR